MPLILRGADSRPIVGKCRICGSTWREGTSDHVMARHMQKCGQKHVEDTHAQRSQLDFLKPWDPEYDEWYRAEYRKGKIKPSTKPV